MKMYKKEELVYTNGMLVSVTGDIVMPSAFVISQANELETRLQKSAYIDAQPAATPMPTLDGFERMSIKDTNLKFSAITPTLDGKVDEALEIMHEIDDIETVQRANAMVEEFSALIRFATDDFVVDCGEGEISFFDTPMLGNPLEWGKRDIADAIAAICGMAQECLTVHDDTEGDDKKVSQIDDEYVVSSLTKLTNEIDDFYNDTEGSAESLSD